MTMRRQTQWFGSRAAWSSLIASAQSNLLLYNTTSLASAPTKGTTVTRMIVTVRSRPDTIAQDVNLAWGIVVVNADARAAGAFPDPEDLGDRAGWLVRGDQLGKSANLSESSQWVITELDLRSQRILRSEQDELHLVVKNYAGATGLEWSAFIRVLMKLPL